MLFLSNPVFGKRHPLFPLLSALFGKCERATSTPRDDGAADADDFSSRALDALIDSLAKKVRENDCKMQTLDSLFIHATT